jgi:glyoxylate reductase
VRVFVTRDLPGPALGWLRREHDVTVWPGRLPPTRQELASNAESADGLLTLLTDRIDADFLRACPRLVAVSNLAVGYENIDVAAATSRGVPVGHTPGVLTEATAQFTLALILALIRRLPEASAAAREGDWLTWDPAGFLGADLAGTTLGLVGYGRIGQEVGRLASTLGIRVLHTSPRSASLTLEELLPASDVVSLHPPLTAETRGLIGPLALSLMKEGALLVNVARGPMVDTQALVQSLHAGHLAGAALDVTDPEPLPADHELHTFPNVIITPHIASGTVRARTLMAEIAVTNLLHALRGERMPYCANPEVYHAAAWRQRSRSAHPGETHP